MMRNKTYKSQFLLLCITVLSIGNIEAQSQKKLQKLADKQKYEKLISSSQKRIKKGERDSISYYYLTLGHLLKSENTTGSAQERSYYSATKSYEKFIARKDELYGYNLQLRMLAQGYTVFNQLSERKKRRRKHYASFFASYYTDTVPEYSELFQDATIIGTENNTDQDEFIRPNDVSTSQKTTNGIPYKIPEVLPSGFDIVKAAETSMGTPWVWAGITPGKGFDCSGFVIWSYHQLGYELPHRTKLLAQIGEYVQPGEYKPSDIVCFGSKSYQPSSVWHVGMIHSVDGDEIKIIHCGTSSGVIVAPLSSGYWSESDYFVVRIEE